MYISYLKISFFLSFREEMEVVISRMGTRAWVQAEREREPGYKQNGNESLGTRLSMYILSRSSTMLYS